MARKILLISPTPTHPETAGNRARVKSLLLGMAGMGHEVHFLHIEMEQGDREMMREAWGSRYYTVPYEKPGRSIRSRLRRRLLGAFIEDARYIFSIDEWYDSQIDSTLKALHQAHEYDTVIVEYVFFSRALECFEGGVLKIIDTHDAFANRHRHYLKKGNIPKWFSTTMREEGKGFDRADVIIAIQDKERDLFSRQTRARIITVGHMVDRIGYDEDILIDGKMLFVGSGNPINVEGARYFIDKVLPRIRRRLPEAVLYVVGGVCDCIEGSPGVEKLGRVEDLREIYASAAVVVNPVFFNTGLSIKNMEAIGYSRPLVTTPGTVNGMERGINKSFLVAREPSQFAQAVIRVLSDRIYARELAAEAGNFASSWNEAVTRQLEEVLSVRQA